MITRPPAVGWVSSQGRYAGAASRFTAYVIDLAVSAGLFALGLAGTSLVAQVVTGHPVSWSRTNIIVAVIFVVWEFVYFGYCWAASGRTFGMAVLGVRVVRADGRAADPWRGAVRALVFPLSFLLFCAGFLGILVQRQHRALHDLSPPVVFLRSGARLRSSPARPTSARGQLGACSARTGSCTIRCG